MFRLSTLTALCLLAGTASGNSLLRGSRELGVSGIVDFDTPADTLIALDLSYGIFPLDYLETGLAVGFRNDDRVTQYRAGGFMDYHFDTGRALIPYLGVAADIAGAEVTFGEIDVSSTALILGLEAGVKSFLNPNVAVATAIGFDFATDEVFPTDDGATDTNWDIVLGLRFYF